MLLQSVTIKHISLRIGVIVEIISQMDRAIGHASARSKLLIGNSMLKEYAHCAAKVYMQSTDL